MSEPRDDNPVSPLLDAAITLHEMYVTFQKAGFSRTEALAIVIASVKPNPPQE